MAQARFLVAGELAWYLALDTVVLDNLLTGQASAGSWQSGATGSAFIVAQALAQARHQLAIVATVGDDLYGKILINQLDMAGIDSGLVAMQEGEATSLRCDINHGKKDSLAIAYVSGSQPKIDLDNMAEAPDWLYLAENCGDLYQISEFLHQAFLHQARTVLQVSQLAERDVKRFGYLLEDVDILVINADVAQKITAKQDLEQAVRILLNDVKTAVIIAKKRLFLTTGQQLVVLETADIAPTDFTALGAHIVAYLTRVKQPDLARVLATAWQAVSDKKYNLREKSL